MQLLSLSQSAAMSSCYHRIPDFPITLPRDRCLRWPVPRAIALSTRTDGIVLARRTSASDPVKRSTPWVFEPVVPAARPEGLRRKPRASPPVAECAAEWTEPEGAVEEVCRVDGGKMSRKAEVLLAAAATVVLGTANRVMYKLALVPLRDYPFFLAQLATFGYVLVYFSILYVRYRSGIITDEMLSLPKTAFMAVGLLEALGAASGMAAGAVLSGSSIPILSQTFLVWQLLLSMVFLGRRYRFNQLLGCFLVTIGVIITVASGSGASVSIKGAGMFWSLVMITSFLFQAADTVLKEVIFVDASKKLKGGSVDLFVVNSFGSAFQALFICLLMPFLSKLWGVPFSQLPMYIKDGAACFLNIGTLSSGCDGAPMLPLLFVLVNMAFNISLLHLLKISSAVVSCLASTFSVPLSIYAFTLPLPYIGIASTLPTGFVTGAMVLVAGLLLYCCFPSPTTQQKASPFQQPQG